VGRVGRGCLRLARPPLCYAMVPSVLGGYPSAYRTTGERSSLFITSDGDQNSHKCVSVVSRNQPYRATPAHRIRAEHPRIRDKVLQRLPLHGTAIEEGVVLRGLEA